jgi:hypothetical protein
VPIQPWSIKKCEAAELRDGASCAVAKITDPHHVEVIRRVGEKDVYNCSPQVPRIEPPQVQRPGDSAFPLDFEGPVCAGVQRDLFPSTTIYVIATFVEPNAKHWDAGKKTYVVGPITSKVYYQFSGIKDVPAASASRCCKLCLEKPKSKLDHDRDDRKEREKDKS